MSSLPCIVSLSGDVTNMPAVAMKVAVASRAVVIKVQGGQSTSVILILEALLEHFPRSATVAAAGHQQHRR